MSLHQANDYRKGAGRRRPHTALAQPADWRNPPDDFPASHFLDEESEVVHELQAGVAAARRAFLVIDGVEQRDGDDTRALAVRLRVQAHDGRFTLTSPPGGPTTLLVELPCGS